MPGSVAPYNQMLASAGLRALQFRMGIGSGWGQASVRIRLRSRLRSLGPTIVDLRQSPPFFIVPCLLSIARLLWLVLQRVRNSDGQAVFRNHGLQQCDWKVEKWKHWKAACATIKGEAQICCSLNSSSLNRPVQWLLLRLQFQWCQHHHGPVRQEGSSSSMNMVSLPFRNPRWQWEIPYALLRAYCKWAFQRWGR